MNVSTGEWSSQTKGDITQMQENVTTPSNVNIKVRTLDAYVVPGTLPDLSNNFIEFEIDNNRYYITGQTINDHITDGFSSVVAGKHYTINLTVSKKQIDNITAAVVDWEDVSGTIPETDVKNTYCTFDFEDRNTKLTSSDEHEFNIYRAAQTTSDDAFITSESVQPNYTWATGYNTNGKATKEYSTDHWTTNWYWENNKTYYHFRAVGIDGHTTSDPLITILPAEAAASNVDYFAITSGAISGSSYEDYTWGAPFKDLRSGDTNDWDTDHPLLTYSTSTGFDNTDGDNHQISQAIGATTSQIQLLSVPLP